jgi:hypothetical protein
MCLLEQLGTFHDISDINLEYLKKIENFEIVIICDDSYSMRCPATNATDFSCTRYTEDSRWNELKKIVSIVVDIATIFDKDGVDVYFLNRKPLFNVTKKEELNMTFSILPEGFTPLVKTLKRVLHDKKNIILFRNLLILIATDGLPYDKTEDENVKKFKKLLKQRENENIYISILACTDDKETIQEFNKLDKKIKKLDIIDDYESERKEVIKFQGSKFKFSFGDYIVKALLGSIDSYYDNLDEKKVKCN